MRMTITHAYSLLLLFASILSAATNLPQNPIPVDDPVTMTNAADAISAPTMAHATISYMRTTPEVWEQAIKRMVRLHGVVITAQDASHICAI